MMRGVLVGVAALAWASAASAAGLPSLAEPSLSPDGREIVFASGGDLWTAPVDGGTASLLVTDAATESRPLFSPDGTRLAFQSNRGGPTNIYVLILATGQVTRLTWSDANERLDGWSRDGRWLYFSSSATDVGGESDVLRVAATGGTPTEVSRERFLEEFGAAPSPDGRTLAIVAKGTAASQWWRNGRSHMDESEVWLKPLDQAGGYRKLLPEGAKQLWPMWTPDGATLYFMSDRSGSENIWRLPLAGGQPQQVTRFTDGRVLWPSISRDGRTIVFERDFGVWRLDAATGQARAVPITLRGAPAGAGLRRLSESKFTAMGLSPDGLKVAVIAHGEVFAASAKDGGTAQRLSQTPTIETEPVWSPDSRRMVYVSRRGDDDQLVEYDFAAAKERVLTRGSGRANAPTWSPDGKKLAYVRDERELRVLDLSSAAPTDTLLHTGFVDTLVAWSPDNQWVAFALTDRKSFTNVHVVPAKGGTARPVSFLAHGNIGRIAWAPDGKFILFDSGQRSEDARMVRVDLLPNVPRHREDLFTDLFKPEADPETPAPTPADPAQTPATDTGERAPDPAAVLADAAKPKGAKPPVQPVRIVFEGIRERASVLPLGMDAIRPVISPEGKTLLYLSRQGDRQSLYSYSLDELAKDPPSPKLITASDDPIRDYAFDKESKAVFLLNDGVVTTTPLEKPETKPVAITAEMDVDFDTEKMVVFEQAWGELNRWFYDPKFHGKDWAAVRRTWAPRIEAARTHDEMRRLLNLMVGELNASHSGVNRPQQGFGAAPPPKTGDLGLRFEREAAEAGRGLVVREVVTLGPAFLEGSIKPGETLVSVDGRAIGPADNLDRLLQGKAGKRTVLGVRGAGGAVRSAVVRPVPLPVAGGLLYRQWVNERRAYVDKLSGGRLGYVHVADMGDESLDQLYLDLDAQNQDRDGVVIDLRHNNGGYVNGRVLDVFTRQNYLLMTPRGQSPFPARQALGQRALGAPTVLLVNESSLSDAEDFTEGYRRLKVGKVVGKPTASWIIYTSNRPMIDGTVVRVPSTRIDDVDGNNMELTPRPVDITVERPLGETLAGRDAQLEAAVQSLLADLGPARTAAR